MSQLETTVILEGKVPSKKNSKRLIWVHGKPRIVPSTAFEKWQRSQVADFPPCQQLIPPYVLTITIYPPDKRGCDLSNQAESVIDLLVDVGMLQDDNWFLLPSVTLQFGGIDRSNPRAEVKILSATASSNAA